MCKRLSFCVVATPFQHTGSNMISAGALQLVLAGNPHGCNRLSQRILQHGVELDNADIRVDRCQDSVLILWLEGRRFPHVDVEHDITHSLDSIPGRHLIVKEHIGKNNKLACVAVSACCCSCVVLQKAPCAGEAHPLGIDHHQCLRRGSGYRGRQGCEIVCHLRKAHVLVEGEDVQPYQLLLVACEMLGQAEYKLLEGPVPGVRDKRARSPCLDPAMLHQAAALCQCVRLHDLLH
mmetsp:Transcript_38585/g.97631  ORF Transcript_38585/g.97631 Transcript_38585/m.97631 type:complete len:235 (+) Transcript_38585:691-1395(+)